MTIRPGCFQSALAAHAATDACARCPDRPECFEGVRRASPGLLAGIERRIIRRGEGEEVAEAVSKRVSRYIDRAMTPPRAAPLRETPRVQGLRIKFGEQGIALADLKRRKNPFRQTDGMWFHMAALITEGYPFKPGDLAEAVVDAIPGTKKSSLASEVSRFVALLVEEGVLERKERRILCLA